MTLPGWTWLLLDEPPGVDFMPGSSIIPAAWNRRMLVCGTGFYTLDVISDEC